MKGEWVFGAILEAVEFVATDEYKKLNVEYSDLIIRREKEIEDWVLFRDRLNKTRWEWEHKKEVITLTNTIQFVQLSMIDIWVCFNGCTTTKVSWEKNYFARQLALHIYEILNDLPGLLGKELKQVIITLSNDSEHPLLQELKEVSQELTSKVMNKFKKELNIIRNITQAHKSCDAMEQMKIIKEVDPDKITLICIYLFGWREVFNIFISGITELIFQKLPPQGINK